MQNIDNNAGDFEIIEQIINGNVDAFEILLKRYENHVLNILKKHLPYEQVEETAQEVFIRAYKSLPGFKQKSTLKHWISSIAVKTCYDFWRKHYKSKEVVMTSLSENQQNRMEKILSDRAGQYFKEEELKNETRELLDRSVIPGEKEALYSHLNKRKKDGVRMNLNHLGEAVLGEGEAQTRLATYLKDMEAPEIEYISVKISTIYSQINSLAFEQTVDVLVERFTRLFRLAKNNVFVRRDGTKSPKFVNLDMEEYRDLEITLAAFTRTLDRSFPDYQVCPFSIYFIMDINPLVFAPFFNSPFLFLFKTQAVGFIYKKIKPVIISSFLMTQGCNPQWIISAGCWAVFIYKTSVITNKRT